MVCKYLCSMLLLLCACFAYATANAITTYNNIVSKIQSRIASRVNSNFSGAKSYSSSDINEKNVAEYQGTVHSGVSSNVKSRNAVAYY